MCFHFQQQHFFVLHYGPNTAVLSPTGSSYFLTWVLLLNNTIDLGRIIPHLDLCQGRAELDLWQDSMVCFLKRITRVFLLTTSQQTHTCGLSHPIRGECCCTGCAWELGPNSALSVIALDEASVALKHKFMDNFNLGKLLHGSNECDTMEGNRLSLL